MLFLFIYSSSVVGLVCARLLFFVNFFDVCELYGILLPFPKTLGGNFPDIRFCACVKTPKFSPSFVRLRLGSQPNLIFFPSRACLLACFAGLSPRFCLLGDLSYPVIPLSPPLWGKMYLQHNPTPKNNHPTLQLQNFVSPLPCLNVTFSSSAVITPLPPPRESPWKHPISADPSVRSMELPELNMKSSLPLSTQAFFSLVLGCAFHPFSSSVSRIRSLFFLSGPLGHTFIPFLHFLNSPFPSSEGFFPLSPQPLFLPLFPR